MAKKTTSPMDAEMKQALDDLKKADGLLRDVIETTSLDESPIQANQIEELRRHMQKPKWKLNTHNLIDGIIAAAPVGLEAIVTFELDTDRLFDVIDKAKQINTDEVDAYIEKYASGETGKDLADIFSDALLPRSYGISTQIDVVTQIVAEKDKEQLKQMDEEIIELFSEKGLVHLDYARLLTHLMPPAISLDAEEFAKHCWVNAEFLRDKEPFSKEFYWQDESMGDALSVRIKSEFERIG